jgi:hypothetical protein
VISGGVEQDLSPQVDSTDITSNLSGLSGSLNIKSVLMNTFLLAFPPDFWQILIVTKKQMNCCWRTDLQDFRGLSHFERSGFLICLEWFENFRLRYSLAAGREAAKAFWKSEVKRDLQLHQPDEHHDS